MQIDFALRQEIASTYTKSLEGKELIVSFVDEKSTSVCPKYSVRVKNKDDWQVALKEQRIPTGVHYQVPLHLQECILYLGYKKKDFPISEIVSDTEIQYICEKL